MTAEGVIYGAMEKVVSEEEGKEEIKESSSQCKERREGEDEVLEGLLIR